MSFPIYRAEMQYHCLGCDGYFSIDELLYTCPTCGSVLLLDNMQEDELKKHSGKKWREIFDTRKMSKETALKGIFRFYELMAPVLEAQDIVYLGEGHTPIVDASNHLCNELGVKFAFKNEGQNPSASFKDRGMAGAYSYLKSLVRKHGWKDVLTVCASTGDTSAAAALYGSYVGEPISTVVLLPHGKVTPQQLAQPLGSGAKVLEIPGVFDDCMKVVEYLAENYRVALLNSKNAWRILGQESYAYEVAQWYDWDLSNKSIFVPIGNAGNITAIMRGFLKMYNLGIIESLPRLFGVQSHHADPVYKYYQDTSKGFAPVKVQPSVAQAAMIGNPVSFPRVKYLAEKYMAIAGENAFNVVQVTEQEIMDSMILANKAGHIACTQGGECLAGLLQAKKLGLISENELAVLDSTAHAIKFSGFQDMYLQNNFDSEYGVIPKKELVNMPELVISVAEKENMAESEFAKNVALAIAAKLNLGNKQ